MNSDIRDMDMVEMGIKDVLGIKDILTIDSSSLTWLEALDKEIDSKGKLFSKTITDVIMIEFNKKSSLRDFLFSIIVAMRGGKPTSMLVDDDKIDVVDIDVTDIVPKEERDSFFLFSEKEFELIGFLLTMLIRFFNHTRVISIIIEENHVDAAYRDMFYNHYSRGFFISDRDTFRYNFFRGTEVLHFFDNDSVTPIKSRDDARSSFIGSVVLGSYGGGYIGRTLMNPQFLIDSSVEIRLSTFSINVRGVKLEVEAFPFRMQDGEMMKCAEITLLNLMCYYSNEYPDYHQVLPSEILKHEKRYANERVTPSLGLSYDKMSKILSDFRFYPRLYNINRMINTQGALSSIEKYDLFKRVLHWYITSGIPVAINIDDLCDYDDGHSIICIGYEDISDYSSLAFSDKVLSYGRRFHGKVRSSSEQRSVGIVHAADFDRRYVVIDDGQLPYSLQKYERLSKSFSNMKCVNYLVPLHRKMEMDAVDAYSNIINILRSPGIGIINWGENTVANDELFVLSMYLSSVRGYKRARIKHEHSMDRLWIANIYKSLEMPHFIWVAELIRKESYVEGKNRKVAIELVLDATSGGTGEAYDRIILMRYPDRIFFRDKNGKERNIEHPVFDMNPISPYNGNLKVREPAEY